MVSFKLWLLYYQGKDHRDPLDRRLSQPRLEFVHSSGPYASHITELAGFLEINQLNKAEWEGPHGWNI
jgi:hypothetical protein